LATKWQWRCGHLFFDAIGQQTAVKNADTGQIYHQIDQRNANGQITSQQFANGTSESVEYHPTLGTVTDINLTGAHAQHSLNLTYDIGGYIDSRSLTYGPTSQHSDTQESYNYDSLNRLIYRGMTILTQGDMPTSFTISQSFPYDGFGNLVSKSGIGLYRYDDQNRLSHIDGFYKNDQRQFSAIDYDNNGNLTFDGNRHFVYSSFDKVVQLADPTNSSQFEYGIGHSRFYRQDMTSSNTRHTAYLGH